MSQPLSSAMPAATPALASTAGLEEPALFVNREQSWLEFNRRVLHEALDERTPLLERVGFLAIFNSNLDEYFQKRVGGLKRQIDLGVQIRTPDGLSAQEQLELIREMVSAMIQQQAQCFATVIKPQLAEHGIHLLKWDQLSDQERRFADQYFQRNLFPVLTPLAVDPGHPFPFISNLSTSLGVILRHPQDHDIAKPLETDDLEAAGLQFARVKVPEMLPGWVQLSQTDAARGKTFIRLDEIIRHNLPDLFEGMQIIDVEPFRITRNADVERDDEDAEDLLELIEQELRDRRFARVVRLEVEDEPSRAITRFLVRELDLHRDDVYEMPSELDYTDLWGVHRLNLPDLKYKPWKPVVPPRLADNEADIFRIIRQGDVLVHHPYESFSASVERFIRTAAKDPKVMAIKATLYRTTEDSPFLPELIRAAEQGKQVVVLVELQARFDEARNVLIAHALEKAGVHVVYGVVGLKTHTKTSLVVRQETEGMRCYAHIGTGNYHSETANLYTDLGLFTCDPRITGELVQLFNFMTGRSVQKDFQHLVIAPTNMRQRFSEMIEREKAHCETWKHRGADPEDPNRPRIVAKMNSLEDKAICQKLYEASQAGVRIELIIRGFCCLRPGVPGLSENISVFSVIGRFLEHSRIFYFHNNANDGGSAEYYIGSADWMYRNLNNRLECITPIYDLVHQKRLNQILEIMLGDQRQAWDMDADGHYTQREPDRDQPESVVGTHRALMRLYKKEAKGEY